MSRHAVACRWSRKVGVWRSFLDGASGRRVTKCVRLWREDVVLARDAQGGGILIVVILFFITGSADAWREWTQIEVGNISRCSLVGAAHKLILVTLTFFIFFLAAIGAKRGGVPAQLRPSTLRVAPPPTAMRQLRYS